MSRFPVRDPEARRRPRSRRRAIQPVGHTARVLPGPPLNRELIELMLPGHHTLTGDVRLHRAFASTVLARSRDVLVYLPPGYEDDHEHRYPVLYVNDGQNVFDGATSYVPAQEWEMDETAERLIRRGELPPLIIVAVHHAAQRRLDEYSPSRDARRKTGGAADLYGRMLAEELKPFIDATYRTSPGASDTGICGSSMGGLAALYLGLRFPGVFGRVAAMSPAVWWDRRVIVRLVEQLRWRPRLRVWLDVGTEEGAGALRDVRALRAAMHEAGWREGVDLSYREEPGAPHSESAWAQRVEPMLRFLFPG
jgi:predicted alpha/beta superfamily hydrolase